jgi:hypothetical protein
MKANAILINPKDNVITLTCDIRKGGEIRFLAEGEMRSLIAESDIPAWNKAATTSIAKGQHILKYNEVIGAATEDILRGGYVSHCNIESLPRDYNLELQ